MEKGEDIQHYAEVLKRRKYQFILPFIICFVLFTGIISTIPSIYRSTGTVLVEPQNTPDGLVQTMSIGFLERRLQELKRIALSNDNLIEIINRFDLYRDLRNWNKFALAERMRKNSFMEMIQTDIFSDRWGGKHSVTYAFTLSFEGKDPEKVGNVANALITLFLEENIKSRGQKAETAFDFLERQKEELKVQIGAIQKKIADFKKENQTRLPELLQTNLRLLGEIQRDIAIKEKDIEYVTRTISKWTSELSVTPKTTGTPESEELKRLRREYLQSVVTLSSHHPDLIRSKNRLTALEEELNSRSESSALLNRLEQKELELAQVKQKYSEKHPDVVRLEKELKSINQELQSYSVESSSLEFSGIPSQQINPQYTKIQTELEIARHDLEKYTQELNVLKAKLQEYEYRVETSSQIDLQYETLLREYESSRSRYKEIMDRLLTAKEVKGLEKNQLAERFTLIEPPGTPTKPVRPNRLALRLLSLVLSTFIGVIVLTIAEYVDRSIHRAGELAELTGLPILTELPYIRTRKERRQKKIAATILWLSILSVFAVILGLMHVYVKPLNTVYWEISQKFNMTFHKIRGYL